MEKLDLWLLVRTSNSVSKRYIWTHWPIFHCVTYCPRNGRVSNEIIDVIYPLSNFLSRLLRQCHCELLSLFCDTFTVFQSWSSMLVSVQVVLPNAVWFNTSIRWGLLERIESLKNDYLPFSPFRSVTEVFFSFSNIPNLLLKRHLQFFLTSLTLVILKWSLKVSIIILDFCRQCFLCLGGQMLFKSSIKSNLRGWSNWIFDIFGW